MIRKRIIPVLLIDKKDALVKTIEFKKPIYVGDPVNAVKIFNDKECDEIIILDINASKKGNKPDFKYLYDIASESFMPTCYGGGVNCIDDIKTLIFTGIEKVSINNIVLEDINFIKEASDNFGSSTIVVSIDVKKDIWGNYKVFNHVKNKILNINPFEFAKVVQEKGAGEILINSVDNDGKMKGYDLQLINKIATTVNIPVIACGGAGNEKDLKNAVDNHASAVAAGSMFVFHGKHKAVLIKYPTDLFL